ncbi:P-loop containing nucleoside triphosphate hydrolase protein [Piptocephalis cylindrospora]|uniref:RNA helicase n=1 Tax=Piptocephalis cylindrospora TaxID=1907219 RepID=A0A4V1IXP7_9FUNG|nr:P-loop containing nucleoside triphosphate hydrolase protein [Piptocephalis cylindrospora]|eukprot:RKP11799.1 P-loop containing nucleoside triphosphate hydrolase protein [Piptocephalis cylindrospora]
MQGRNTLANLVTRPGRFLPLRGQHAPFFGVVRYTSNLRALARQPVFLPKPSSLAHGRSIRQSSQLYSTQLSELSAEAAGSFSDLGIRSTLVSMLASELKITQPSVIQERLIPHILHDKPDLLVRDVTGSGKSLGILLAILSTRRRNARDTSPTAIVLTPSRELAQQFLQWTRLLIPSSVVPNLDPIIQVAVRDAFADVSAEESLKYTTPHILVGTPGYVQELYGKGLFDTDHTRSIVLDEADTLVKLPRKHASIRQRFHRERHPSPTSILMDVWCRGSEKESRSKPQVILVSATMSVPLRNYAHYRGWLGAQKNLREESENEKGGKPMLFLDGTDGTVRVAPRIQHHCLAKGENLSKKQREELAKQVEQEKRTFFVDTTTEAVAIVAQLSGILDPEHPPQDVLVFAPASYSMEDISGGLLRQGLPAKDEETNSAGKCPARTTTFWVGGEQTARGLDIPGCEWVFFLGAPKSIMSYVHVSGRTGRQGGAWHSGTGRCMTIIPAWQEGRMRVLYGSMKLHVDPYEYVAS